MKIIGIDPGTAITGFGIIEVIDKKPILREFGCIKTSKDSSMPDRLHEIAGKISNIIKIWQPHHASLEKIFFNKNVKTAATVLQARGVVLQKLVENNVSTSEFTPLEIKNAVCGYGRADKKMIQKMIQIIFKLKEAPKPDDAADAIAAALCHVYTLKT